MCVTYFRNISSVHVKEKRNNNSLTCMDTNPLLLGQGGGFHGDSRESLKVLPFHFFFFLTLPPWVPVLSNNRQQD